MSSTQVKMEAPAELYGAEINVSGGRSYRVNEQGFVWIDSSVISEFLNLGFWPVQSSVNDGDDQFVHNEVSPSATWTINHNRGSKPSSVRLLSVGGVEMEGDIQDITDNQTIVYFNVAVAGKAIVS